MACIFNYMGKRKKGKANAPFFFAIKSARIATHFEAKHICTFARTYPNFCHIFRAAIYPIIRFRKTSGSAEQSLPNPTHKTITVSFAINLIITS